VSRLLISGFYGFDNAGDEAVLAAMVQLFREQQPEVDLTVLSAAPDATRRLHGVEALPRMARHTVGAAIASCDLFVSGGGSLLQDATSARSPLYYLALIYLATRAKKPVALYCQGIGPLRRLALRRLTRLVLNRVSPITVRDAESARELERLGVGCEPVPLFGTAEVGERGGEVLRSWPQVHDASTAPPPHRPTIPSPHHLATSLSQSKRPPVYIAADPVFALSPAPDFDAGRWLPPLPDHGWLGVSVRPWPGLEAMLPRLAEALRHVETETGLKPLLLPLQWDMDQPVCERLATLVSGVAMLKAPGLDPRGWLALVGGLRGLVAMRLHALIFAASQGIPLTGIAYDPKITALLERLGDRPAATVQTFDAAQFCERVCSALTDAAASAQRRDAMDGMAAAARRATALTLELLRGR
jgi:polysaccharide pyruvyl transferase WcaK-like protein